MLSKRSMLRNPEVILITLFLLTLILTFVFGLHARQNGRAVPTDQVYITPRAALVLA